MRKHVSLVACSAVKHLFDEPTESVYLCLSTPYIESQCATLDTESIKRTAESITPVKLVRSIKESRECDRRRCDLPIENS